MSNRHPGLGYRHLTDTNRQDAFALARLLDGKKFRGGRIVMDFDDYEQDEQDFTIDGYVDDEDNDEYGPSYPFTLIFHGVA